MRGSSLQLVSPPQIRQPRYLRTISFVLKTGGFASPPLNGFAFVKLFDTRIIGDGQQRHMKSVTVVTGFGQRWFCLSDVRERDQNRAMAMN
jgi:hypothetical protein